MTADEFRKMLDRFHEALERASMWAANRSVDCDDQTAGFLELHGVWCDLNRECSLMKDAERRDDDVAKPPPISASLRQRCPELLDDGEDRSPSWAAETIPENSEASTVRTPTPSEVNAEEIGKLQAAAKAMEKRIQDIAQAAAEGFEMVSDAALADWSVPE